MPGAPPLSDAESAGVRKAERPDPVFQTRWDHTESAERPSAQSQSTGAPLDLSKLPPIEAISAETDIRPFLAPGVPVELARAALRRAWAADPKVREFVGLCENSWDFNAGAIPGFGALEVTDELRRHVAQLLSPDIAEHQPTPSTSLPHESQEHCKNLEESGDWQAQPAKLSSQASVPLGKRTAFSGRPSEGEASPNPITGYAAAREPHEGRPAVSAAKRLHGRALPK
jgi:hypothetical protein